MVKINQPEVAQKYNIVNSPSLVYFRKKVPLLYDGKYSLLLNSLQKSNYIKLHCFLWIKISLTVGCGTSHKNTKTYIQCN
jgi:hypothetical protein